MSESCFGYKNILVIDIHKLTSSVLLTKPRLKSKVSFFSSSKHSISDLRLKSISISTQLIFLFSGQTRVQFKFLATPSGILKFKKSFHLFYKIWHIIYKIFGSL